MAIQTVGKLGVALCLMSTQICANSVVKNSLFTISVNGPVLTINTTIPNHTYPAAGIKINTPNYAINSAGAQCTLGANGYCLFSVGNTSPASIEISGPEGRVSFNLCLSGKGAMSCESYAVVVSPFPTLTFVSGYLENPTIFSGTSFIPKLGEVGALVNVWFSQGDPSCNPDLMTQTYSGTEILNNTNAQNIGLFGAAACQALCKISFTGPYTGQNNMCTNPIYQNNPYN